MRSVSIVLAAVAALILAFLALAAHAEAPLTILRAANSYIVNADGTYTETYRAELRPANDAAARREAQQAFTYNPAQEDFAILEAATHKADGRIIRVGADAIRDQFDDDGGDHSMLSDDREKVVVFPDVAGGDTLVYAFRRTVHRAVLPGQFFAAVYLGQDTPLLDYDLSVRAPRSLALHIETHGMDATAHRDGDSIVYAWHAAVTDPQDPAVAVSPFDRLPRVFISSEPDWTSFARDYAALVLPHARVTPAIQALADRIAGAAPTRREQARLLYEWVNAHIRYVAIYLGDGALEPHDAEAVLANGWGDCKDHEVLLQALLAARGIASSFVLINLEDAYSLSGPPTFAQLDHAITYLPEFDLYADSTAAMAGFGVLPFGEYGKPAILVGGRGPVQRRIPPLPAGDATALLHTDAMLHADGTITGTTLMEAGGPFATELRRDAAWIEATGDSAAGQQLRALGEDGGGSFDEPDAPRAALGGYRVSGTFTLEAYPELLDGDSFALPVGLRLLSRPGDTLLGPREPRTLADGEPAPCFAGRQTEEIALTLPPGRRLARLPQDLALQGDWGSFHATWQVQGDTVTRRSELVSRLADSLCRDDQRRTLAGVLARIRRELRTQIALAPQAIPLTASNVVPASAQ